MSDLSIKEQKKNNKSIRRLLLQIFNGAFIVIGLYILVTIIFKVQNRAVDGQFIADHITPMKVIIALVVELIFFGFMGYITSKIDKKYLKIISIINILIVLILSILFGYLLSMTPEWDFGTVYHTAVTKALHGGRYLPKYYYNWYPNNIFITLILYWVYKFLTIFKITSFFKISIGLNISLIMISVIATYFLIKDLYGERTASVASFFFIALTPMYAYASIFYTDTFTLMYLPIVYLLYRKYLKTNRWWYLIIMGIIAAVGVGIKNNIAIGIIAMAIFVVLTLKNIRKMVKFFVVFGASFLIVTGLITAINQYSIPRPLDQAGIPYTHWIMMGMAGHGAWNQHDFDATISLVPSKAKMEAFNKKIIKERLEAYGPVGYLEFLNKKAAFTWGSGDLYAAQMLMWGAQHPDSTMYNYVVGSENGGFLLFSQAGEAMLILMILVGCIRSFKDKDLTFIMFNICMFGVFVFLLMWETTPRYVVCILPIMIASASNGLNKFINIKRDVEK